MDTSWEHTCSHRKIYVKKNVKPCFCRLPHFYRRSVGLMESPPRETRKGRTVVIGLVIEQSAPRDSAQGNLPACTSFPSDIRSPKNMDSPLVLWKAFSIFYISLCLHIYLATFWNSTALYVLFIFFFLCCVYIRFGRILLSILNACFSIVGL